MAESCTLSACGLRYYCLHSVSPRESHESNPSLAVALGGLEEFVAEPYRALGAARHRSGLGCARGGSRSDQ